MASESTAELMLSSSLVSAMSWGVRRSSAMAIKALSPDYNFSCVFLPETFRVKHENTSFFDLFDDAFLPFKQSAFLRTLYLPSQTCVIHVF
jgi:hypothetical protein